MKAETLQRIVEEAVRDANTEKLWILFFVLIIVAVVGFISSYFGSYAQRKAQNLATKEDFQHLLDQNKETTRATEEIKSEILRHSSFREKVLMERYQLINDINDRLEMVRQDYERIKKGRKPRTEIKEGETFLLTGIVTMLELKRWILTPSFYDPLMERYEIVSTLWQHEYNGKEWKQKIGRWTALNDEIQSQMKIAFQL